jgi:hypothetical protein
MTKVRTAPFRILVGIIVFATLSACSSTDRAAWRSSSATAPAVAGSSGKPLPSRTPTVDAKQVLSTICSTIPTALVASLFHVSGVKVAQGSVDQHGQWESTTCGITGSGGLSLSTFAQIGPPSVSAQDGLQPIVQQSGVSDVRQLSGIGTAGAAVEFRQKVDTITENVVCVAKQAGTGTVVMGVVDADNHGYQPLIQLLSQLAT